jgi:hypothetical protein
MSEVWSFVNFSCCFYCSFIPDSGFLHWSWHFQLGLCKYFYPKLLVHNGSEKQSIGHIHKYGARDWLGEWTYVIMETVWSHNRLCASWKPWNAGSKVDSRAWEPGKAKVQLLRQRAENVGASGISAGVSRSKSLGFCCQWGGERVLCSVLGDIRKHSPFLFLFCVGSQSTVTSPCTWRVHFPYQVHSGLHANLSERHPDRHPQIMLCHFSRHSSKPVKLTPKVHHCLPHIILSTINSTLLNVDFAVVDLFGDIFYLYFQHAFVILF